MYLMGFVNSTFETRRPTGNLELVDLSLEKKYHPPEQVESHLKELGIHHLSDGNVQSNGSIVTVSCVNGRGTLTSTKMENRNVGKGDGATPIMIPSIVKFARPRRPSVEDLPPDLYMEPLCPLVLRSPDGKRMPVFVLEKDIASSGHQELDQEWSFWDLTQRVCQDTSRMTTISEIRLAPSVFTDGGIATRVQHHPLETTQEDQGRDSEYSDADTRDTIAVNSSVELSCEDVGRGDNVLESLPNSDEGYGRILQHLERMEGSVKDLKARIDDAKLRIEQSEQNWGVQAPPITTPPRAADSLDQIAKVVPSLSPSLSSPVMEKMGAMASPELPYSWNKKVNPNLPKESDEPVMEERDLQHSPPMVESDVQDVLSFRLWEQDSSAAANPKRRSRRSSVSRAFEELDLETALDLVADEYAKSTDLKLHLPNSSGHRRFRVRNSWDSVGKDDGVTDAASSKNVKIATKKPPPPNFDALLNLRNFDLRSRSEKPKVDMDVKVDVEVEVLRCEEASQPEDFNPSPCSFTCGLSPTSLFSDDQEPFHMSVSSDENMFVKSFCHVGSHRKSPRSVLSPKDEEPDEISHSTSDCSETQEEDHQKNSCAYLYDDESSDLESPMKAKSVGVPGVSQMPFPTFTYSVGKEMGETSSSSEEDRDDDPSRDDTSTTLENASVADLAELGFFQEAANHWEPWLVKDDDGVLDDSDLEFLLSPDFRIQDITTSIISHREKHSPLHTREQQIIQRPASGDEKSELADQKTSRFHESPRRPKRWVPYVTGELHGNDVSPIRSPVRGGSQIHGKDSEVFVASLPAGADKKNPQRPPKRSVNFAPDLVKEIPYSPGPTLDKKPAPLPGNPRAKPNVKHRHDGDERVDVSVSSTKTWEVEEEGPSIMASRRRWRRNREPENGTSSPGGSSRAGSSSWESGRSGTRRQRVAQVVPCAGRMFSWPQRLSFKVSRGKGPMDSDEERNAGDGSFGMSARRDAEQVRRILKGSQKKYSNLTVAEIMKEDFIK